MALIATQQVDRDGVAVTFAAATAGGDTAAPNDHSALIVKNGGTAAITVTLATPQTVDGLAVEDTAVSVAAGAETLIPLYPHLYRNPATGVVNITYSAVASVTVAVVNV